MIDPQKFDLENETAFFISTLWFIMSIVFYWKIINYDVKNSERNKDIPWNSRILENLEYWPIYEKYFSKINSMDKITWKNFVEIVKDKYPDFDERKFLKDLEKNFVDFDDCVKNVFIHLASNYIWETGDELKVYYYDED